MDPIHREARNCIESDLVYFQTDKGQETLTPEEFAQRYNWTNDPTRVRLTGK